MAPDLNQRYYKRFCEECEGLEIYGPTQDDKDLPPDKPCPCGNKPSEGWSLSVFEDAIEYLEEDDFNDG